MNQYEAMRETIELITKKHQEGFVGDEEPDYSYLPESLRPAHLFDMWTRVQLTPTMSASKLGRWLGWIQCAAVALEFATLDDMKELNKRYADE